MKNIDFLVIGGAVVTMNPQREIILKGAVAIDAGRILEVGKSKDLRRRYLPRETLGDHGKLVTPGFIDCHNHAPHFLSKGFIDDMRYPERWRDRVWPYEAGISEEETQIACTGTFIEMIKNGTTCFWDPGALHPRGVGRAAASVGIRGTVSHLTWDVHDPSAPAHYNWTTEEALEAGKRTIEELHNSNEGRLRGSFSLVRGAHVSDRLCELVRTEADAMHVAIHAHCATTQAEYDATMQSRGCTPVERFHRAGILGPSTQLVHMGFLADADIDTLAALDVSVCHCPSASMFGGFGCVSHGRFPELVDRNVRVTLGTDAAAVSRFLDLVRSMYLVACAHKDVKADPTVIGAYKALEMATVNGARSQLWEEDIGSLEAGKCADVVIIDASGIEWQPAPLSNAVGNLVYSSSGSAVRSVLIDGRLVMNDRHMTFVDETEYIREAHVHSRKILERLRIEPNYRWPYI